MKRYILLTLILATFFGASAQSIAVKSFQPLPMDMTASSLEGKRIDQNGEVAALIKVVTTQKGFKFEGGTLGIVDTKQESGEVWVWVPRGSRKITIKHDNLGVLRDYRFPMEIEAERTYEMVLVTGKVETIVKEEVRQQYLAFKITPSNAILEVNDKLWTVEADGSAIQYVDFGTYTYRVRAANYHPDAGSVTVDDPDHTKMVTVTLVPDFAEVTLKVDADAEIWVNDEKKGVRTWKGSLGQGTYKIECKQAGHESTVTSKEITSEMNGQTIVLTAPRPLYGALMVESIPSFSQLFIDGKDMGTTPKSINEILVGPHVIKLSKDGYDDHIETVTITQGERKQIKPTLKGGSNLMTTKPQEQQKPKPNQATKPYYTTTYLIVLANAAYSTAPQTSFGLTIGSVRRIGWYASFGTNFDFSGDNFNYECDQTGQIYDTSLGEYYFDGTTKTKRLSATAGLVFRLGGQVYAYLGGGYGERRLAWRMYDEMGYCWAKNTDRSYKGLALDGGLMFNIRGIGLSLGVQTVGFDYMEAKLGIGIF